MVYLVLLLVVFLNVGVLLVLALNLAKLVRQVDPLGLGHATSFLRTLLFLRPAFFFLLNFFLTVLLGTVVPFAPPQLVPGPFATPLLITLIAVGI
jgi:hypothetical protein